MTRSILIKRCSSDGVPSVPLVRGYTIHGLKIKLHVVLLFKYIELNINNP